MMPSADTIASLTQRYPNLPVAEWAEIISHSQGVRNPDGLLVSCCRKGQAPHDQREPEPQRPFTTGPPEPWERATPEVAAAHLKQIYAVLDGKAVPPTAALPKLDDPWPDDADIPF